MLGPGTEIHISVLVAALPELLGTGSRQGWKKRWCWRKGWQCWSLSCRMVMLREPHGLGCPSQAGLKAECSGMCLDTGSWCHVCVLRRYRKGLRESRNPSASLAPPRDADGGCELPWVFWGGKVCPQLGKAEKCCQGGPEPSGSKAHGEPRQERGC